MFDQVRKYGQDTRSIPVGLLLLCGRTRPTRPQGRSRPAIDRSDRPTTIYVAGHMHLLGRSIRVELNPGTPRAKILLDIPRWDFHWQGSYVLAATRADAAR